MVQSLRADVPASPDGRHVAVQYALFCLLPFALSLVIPAVLTVGVAALLPEGTQGDVRWHNLVIGLVLNTSGWALWALGVRGTLRNRRRFRAARSQRVAWARSWQVVSVGLAVALSMWGVVWTLFFLSPHQFL